MNFKEMQDELSLVLNFTSGVVDQDFTTDQLKAQLNRAYTREVREAKQHCGYSWFRTHFDFFWPSSLVTFDLGTQIAWQELYRFEDITSNNPGQRLVIGDIPSQTDAWWINPTTLQWGQTGPNGDKTIRVWYLSKAEKLVDDVDEPRFVPPEFRELLVWSAAVYLRTIADEMAPQSWLGKLQDLQHDYWKALSKGRPHTYVPRVRPSQADSDELDVYGYYY